MDNNYFQVIDGIKYDTGQATLLAKGESTSELVYEKKYKKSYFSKVLLKKINDELISFKNLIRTTDYYLYKGINNNYFIHCINYKEIKFTNENITTVLYNKKFDSQSIGKIKQEEAIDYYFNGYKNFSMDKKIKLELIVSEQEAFGEIPVA